MTPGEFTKRRELIEFRQNRSREWRSRAMRRLVIDAGAVVVVNGSHQIGWQMVDGKIVCSKRRYKNQDTAEQHLAMIQSHGTGDVKPQRAYFCPFCAGWHLTKRPE